MSGLELENMLETIYYHEDTWGKFLSKMLNVEKILFMDNENVAFLVLSHIKKYTMLHVSFKLKFLSLSLCVY